MAKPAIRSGGDRIQQPPQATQTAAPEKKPPRAQVRSPQTPRKAEERRPTRSGGDRISIPPVEAKHVESLPTRRAGNDDADEIATEPAAQWGRDDDGPAAAISLLADLPGEPAASDHDPVTAALVDEPTIPLGDDVASVVGVRFVPAGRLQWFDAGDLDLLAGDRVMVDTDRGARLAWIALPPSRKPVRDRGLRRVMRRANDQDLRGERDGDGERVRILRLAKDAANKVLDRDQRPLMKVYRVELQGTGRGGKLLVYYTSDDRLDLREFLRELAAATGARIELRQLGVRDEAKAIGGIGSCGLTLCCTTWLPDFVPVSIKMAKDQGLVLSPTKVSGQCGRLKCCLVYEQAGYAELRKGLPKLGKRVIAARGEGRVVEVDVLRQRVRVSYGPGETEMLPASEVRPMFPSGNPSGKGGAPDEHDEPAEPDEPDAPTEDSAPSDA